MFRRLCIVGLGLMGGAVGMAARRNGAALRVMGVTSRPETTQKAKALGAVDDATLDLRLGVQDADLVVIAVPVAHIARIAQAVIDAAAPGTVITDVGSTKAAVVAAVEALSAKQRAQAHFVGSHPLAGSEKTGIEAAGQVQLAGSLCILTPTPATDNECYHQVDGFWKALGMRTMRLSPQEHDALLARSSHFPHLLAYALVNAQSDRSLSVCGPALRDMTRLAGSDVALWTDIITQNAGELSKLARDFGQEMLQLADDLDALAARGTPGAETARERLFRRLADARQRHDERLRPAPQAPEQPQLGAAGAAGPSRGD